MHRHRLDPLSLAAGLLFVTVGAAFLARGSGVDVLEAGVLVPGVIAAIVVLLLVTLPGGDQGSRPSRRASARGSPGQASTAAGGDVGECRRASARGSPGQAAGEIGVPARGSPGPPDPGERPRRG